MNPLTFSSQVHAAIAEDRSNVSGAARRKFPDDAKPWVPEGRYECQFKACLGCFRQGIDKSKTGIDAIVEGDISPGLATGFAFSQLGERPVMDARVVANLGLCPPVLPEVCRGPKSPPPFF
ncbi:hypothetical protein B0T24DRAFT_615253 [Lasiosphaeria ovina]|uniref:Uncharacterized protein n=1 Tax=Lasiosphaeria ovina TaxID=92902 RepID=A0AAE0TUE3_9PEZI|nr:hypothetical protein B0T24DRAFT_615253 [Lasiosphaeria ovina]